MLRLRFIVIPGPTKDISKMFFDSLLSKQIENKKILRKTSQRIRHLARQGLALRGHHEENYIELLYLRPEDDALSKEWFLKKTKKYTSPTIQNQILEDISLVILRDFLNRSKGVSSLVLWQINLLTYPTLKNNLLSAFDGN